MSEESVRAFLAENAPDIQIEKLDRGSETSWLSAAWNIKPAQIAKTLSLRVGSRIILLVTCGDSRLDNGKIKAVLGGKAKMLRSDEATAITGHTVGGICPFGVATPLPVYCDILLRDFTLIVTGAGSTHGAIKIAPQRMAELTQATWVDVCEYLVLQREQAQRW